MIVNGQAVQPIGARNAPGRVKLNPPNPHHVYLHDAPRNASFNGGAYETEDE